MYDNFIYSFGKRKTSFDEVHKSNLHEWIDNERKDNKYVELFSIKMIC